MGLVHVQDHVAVLFSQGFEGTKAVRGPIATREGGRDD
jgi:hypothetical protein